MYGQVRKSIGGIKTTSYDVLPYINLTGGSGSSIPVNKLINNTGSVMQLQAFKEQLERYIKSVNGNGQTVVSIKADDMRTLIALAEERLRDASREFPGGKVKIELPGSELPKEPSVLNSTPVNAIQDRKRS